MAKGVQAGLASRSEGCASPRPPRGHPVWALPLATHAGLLPQAPEEISAAGRLKRPAQLPAAE